MSETPRSLDPTADSNPTTVIARPRDLLLDVEGTTSDINFVHQVLFPYARDRISAFVSTHRDRPDVERELENARTSLRNAGMPADNEEDIIRGLIEFIDRDVKDTALKSIQGMIWRAGFETGVFRAHVYPDVAGALRRWSEAGLRVSIYSSGSVAAQKLFFEHSTAGNLRSSLHTHFDTRVGPKKDAQSYRRIAAQLGSNPAQIVFLSDVAAELEAAGRAGFRIAQVVRPGTEPEEGHLCVADFDEAERALDLLSSRE